MWLRAFICLFGKLRNRRGIRTPALVSLCTRLREKLELSNPLGISVWQIIKLRPRNWPIGKSSRLSDLEGVILMQPKQLEKQESPLNLNHIQSVFTVLTWASWGVCTPKTWAPGQETRKVVDSTVLICTSTPSTADLWGRSSFPEREPWGHSHWSPKSEHRSLGGVSSASTLQGGGILGMWINK